MESSKLLKNFLTGGSNVLIKKSAGGISKKAFVAQLLNDTAVLNKVKDIRTKNNIKGSSFSNHPNENEIHEQLIQLLNDNADGNVSIKSSKSSKPNKSDKSDKSSKSNMITKPVVPRVSGYRTPEQIEKDKVGFLNEVITYEVNRQLGNYDIFNKPKKFDNWSEDPLERAIQKEWVRQFTANAHKGKYLQYANVNYAGMGGTGGKGSEGAELELGELLLNEALESEGLSQALGLNRTNQAGIATRTPQQEANDKLSGMSGEIRDVTRNVMNSDSVQQQLKERADRLKKENPEEKTPEEPEVRPPDEQKTEQLIPDKTKTGEQHPDIWNPTDRDNDIRRGGQTQVRPRDDPPYPGGSQTIHDNKPTEEKKETDAKDPPYYPVPVVTDNTKKPDPIKKPEPRPPIPPTETITDDTDTDDDDDPEDPKDEKIKDAKIFSELRPFFMVGGEDMLRISEAEKQREQIDKTLFSYVPGYVYDSADNPLTHARRLQDHYRFYRTKPDAAFVDKPRQFKTLGPSVPFINPYGQKNDFIDTMTPAAKLLGHQDRRTNSGFVDMYFRPNQYPDVSRAATNKGYVHESMMPRSLRFASKSIF